MNSKEIAELCITQYIQIKIGSFYDRAKWNKCIAELSLHSFKITKSLQ